MLVTTIFANFDDRTGHRELSYRYHMRLVHAICLLVPSLAVAGDFGSKTWMYQGCKIHVTTGMKEAASIGTYLISVVSSTGKRATVRGDRDGTLSSAWASDLDGDGKFEVIVSTQSAGSGSYGKIGIFTWTGAGLKNRVVPELTAGQMKGYMGHDQYSVTRNQIYRTYPLYSQKSNDPAKRIGMKTARLNLLKFRWEAA